MNIFHYFWYFRILLFYCIILLLSFVSFFIMLFLFSIQARYETKYVLARLYSFLFIRSLELICDIRYEVDGLKNIPNRNCVVALNHQSFWDNIIVVLLFPMQSWVMKRELFNIPFFGWGLRMLNPIAIDRNNNFSVSQILKEGTAKISQGLWVIIFPEGTRLHTHETRIFKPSAAKLAIQNNAPILPVAHNAGSFWPKGFWMKNPGVIKIKIGAIIPTNSDDNAREITQLLENWINKEKDQLQIEKNLD